MLQQVMSAVELWPTLQVTYNPCSRMSVKLPDAQNLPLPFPCVTVMRDLTP